MSVQDCIAEILRRGLDDWIQAAEVASVARTVGGAESEDEVRQLSLMIFRDLLGRRLMEVGMVTKTGFAAWGIAADQALRRIEMEWRALPTGPELGEICWLNLTDEGSDHLRDVTGENRLFE